MHIEELGVTVNAKITKYLEDPVPLASVSRAWAFAIAELGVHVLSKIHTRHTDNAKVLEGSSYNRIIYYMSVGRVAPHPGNFAAPLDATHPIWPFPVPGCWQNLLRKWYRRFPTPVDTGKCVVCFQLPSYGYGEPGQIAHRQKPVCEADDNLPSTLDNSAKIIASMSRLWPVPRDNVFSVGPLYVAIPNAFTDLAGPPVAVDAHGQPYNDGCRWQDGALVADCHERFFELPDHLVLWLRRVSPSCVAIMAGAGAGIDADLAYCAGVVWWTKRGGLRVRQYGRPGSPDHRGWALPPLDADQHKQPVFVLKWGADEPIIPKVTAASDAAEAEGGEDPQAKRARLATGWEH